jgi:four helix bundle protein
MLRIYEDARVACREVGGVANKVARMDGDLARQMRRAMCSVLLNLKEGSLSRGGNRNARYASAMASANEVVGCLDCAEDLGYAPIDAALVDKLEKVVGIRCTRTVVRTVIEVGDRLGHGGCADVDEARGGVAVERTDGGRVLGRARLRSGYASLVGVAARAPQGGLHSGGPGHRADAGA